MPCKCLYILSFFNRKKKSKEKLKWTAAAARQVIKQQDEVMRFGRWMAPFQQLLNPANHPRNLLPFTRIRDNKNGWMKRPRHGSSLFNSSPIDPSLRICLPINCMHDSSLIEKRDINTQHQIGPLPLLPSQVINSFGYSACK